MTCTTNNVSNNDIFITIIEKICYNKNINFNKDENHVWYLAYIINLVVQDVLKILKAGNPENEDIENKENIYYIIPKV